MECWRPVVGFEDFYEVSNIGRVRSKTRKGVTGKIRKLSVNHRGYPEVGLHCNGLNKFVLVHWLVAYTFIGPRPIGRDINHKDGIKTNNSVDNLEYVTKSENSLHGYRVLRKNQGGSRAQSKLKETDIPVIRDLLRQGFSLRVIAEQFNVFYTTINSIKIGRNWSHIPDGDFAIPVYTKPLPKRIT